MTAFKFGVSTSSPLPEITSAALGSAALSGIASATDVGKAVKLGTANNYELCGDGDEIEGVITTVENYSVNDGYVFGGVQKNKRVEAEAGVGGVTIGDLVVCGAQSAAGVAGNLVAKTGTPATFIWRVISIVSGTGVAGDTVLIERV